MSVSLPAPVLMSEPRPVMVPPNVASLDRFQMRMPLSVTLPAPIAPVVPPLPTCNVPVWIVVPSG